MTSDLDEALKKHRAGRLDEAEQDYQAILKADPKCAEAWHLLGVIALQRDDPKAAEPMLEKALSLSPDNAKFLNNYGVAAERRGKMRDAAARFAKSAAIDPDFAEAHTNHGTALQALGRLEDAKQAFGRALALEPKVLFLDEPTAGLDPIAATEFDNLVTYLQSSLDLTIVMITHDVDTLFGVCDRVAVLVDGRVVLGSAAEVAQSDHPWIRRYFGDPRALRARQTREEYERPQ